MTQAMNFKHIDSTKFRVLADRSFKPRSEEAKRLRTEVFQNSKQLETHQERIKEITFELDLLEKDILRITQTNKSHEIEIKKLEDELWDKEKDTIKPRLPSSNKRVIGDLIVQAIHQDESLRDDFHRLYNVCQENAGHPLKFIVFEAKYREFIEKIKSDNDIKENLDFITPQLEVEE